MATCKECLHFDVCVAFMYSEIDICNTMDECKEKHANDDVCDLFMPTADVVPKSEVDKWFRECEELQGRLIELKKEVAREIFEEIKKFDCRPIPESNAVYIIGESKFAELKKKYMESEDTK